jgi:hypothetical protein
MEREFEGSYNVHRPHQGIPNARPLPSPIADPDQTSCLKVCRRDRLGRPLHEYEHVA